MEYNDIQQEEYDEMSSNIMEHHGTSWNITEHHGTS